jgi:chromosome segregation ATPase
VKKAAEYLQLADECRQMARTALNEEHREQLLKMAATWESLAETREGLIQHHPELDTAEGDQGSSV